mgnify:CR=1 FL=1
MLFLVISETLYSYLCNNRKLVCSMLSSAVFQKTSPRSLGWNTGCSRFSEPGCHKELVKIMGKIDVLCRMIVSLFVVYVALVMYSMAMT